MVLLDRCPVLYKCCNCAELRCAVVMIATLGMVIGTLYLAAYSAGGAQLLYDMGAPRAVKKLPLRYAHGVLGVLVFAAHALLMGAACVNNRTLCELYVWSMFVVLLGALAVNLVVIVTAMRADLVLYAVLFLCVTVCTVAMSLYFMAVVVNYSKTLPGIK